MKAKALPLLVGSLAALGVASSASAQSISVGAGQDVDINLFLAPTPTDFGQIGPVDFGGPPVPGVAIPSFRNPIVGAPVDAVLNSVVISLTGDLAGTVTYNITEPNPTVTTLLAQGALAVNFPGLPDAIITAPVEILLQDLANAVNSDGNPDTSATFTPGPPIVDNTEIFNTTGGSVLGQTFGGFTASDTQGTTLLPGNAAFGAFAGSGTVIPFFDAQEELVTASGSGFSASINGSASASYVVTYNFTTVPEVPFEMESAVGLILLGLGSAWKLRNRKKIAS